MLQNTMHELFIIQRTELIYDNESGALRKIPTDNHEACHHTYIVFVSVLCPANDITHAVAIEI